MAVNSESLFIPNTNSRCRTLKSANPFKPRRKSPQYLTRSLHATSHSKKQTKRSVMSSQKNIIAPFHHNALWHSLQFHILLIHSLEIPLLVSPFNTFSVVRLTLTHSIPHFHRFKTPKILYNRFTF